MSRPRKNPADRWMPDRVYKNQSSYVFKPRGTRQTITLCNLDAPKHKVIQLWEAERKKLEQPTNTLSSLADEFFASEHFLGLAASTQRDYRDKNAPKVLAVFGKMDRNKVRPEHIRAYMDKRGLKSRVQANREKSFLSMLYQWGYERGRVKGNPCKGVRSFTEKARTRYITDDEYAAVFKAGDAVVRKAMEIAYCCGLRTADVLGMKRSQFQEEGIVVKQQKNGTTDIREWSPRLRAAIETKLPGPSSATYVIHNAQGQAITSSAFRTRWKKAKDKAALQDPDLVFDFTFHDIKAKAVSDYEGNKQDFSGHKTAAMVAVYDRKMKRVKSH